jgi:hypothetical protein
MGNLKIQDILIVKTRIIVVALSTAPVMLFLVSVWLFLSSEANPEEAFPLHIMVLTLMATVGGFAIFLWGATIADRIIQTVPDKPVMSWFIVLGALREGPALLGGVVFLLAVTEGIVTLFPWIWFAAVPVLLMIQGTIASFPDKQRFEDVFKRIHTSSYS